MLLEPQFLSIVPAICYTWCFYINYTSYQISSKKFNFQYNFRTYEVTKIIYQPPMGQVTPIFLHISFIWIKIKLHPEIHLPRLPGTALWVWVGWWWWSNSLLCHSQLELRLSWTVTTIVKDEGWMMEGMGVNLVTGFCIFHLIRLK